MLEAGTYRRHLLTHVRNDHERMRKGWIILEVPLAFAGLAWGHCRLHCQPFTSYVGEAPDIVQLSK